MDKSSLLGMLGLKEAPARAVPSKSLPAAPKRNVFTGPSSSTALVLDEWDLEQGRTLAKDHPGTEDLALADFHGAAFLEEPRTSPGGCTDPRRFEFVKSLLETPDFQALRQSTKGNAFSSEMAALNLADGFSRLKEEDAKQAAKPKPKKPLPPGKAEIDAEMALVGAVGAGIAKAAEEVESLEDACNALGLGGNGGTDGQMNAQRVAEIFNKVRNDATLRRICELAGRYRLAAQAKQREKTDMGVDDMIGITTDDDPSKLLAHELARLDDEDLELETLLRIESKQAMARQYQGVEKKGKGPIIVVVDESGSMSGDPVCNAKAFALSLAWIARHQNRWIALVGFAGGTVGTRLAMPPGKWDENALCDWLTHMYGGGTDCDVPLQQLPNVYWPEFVAKGMKQGETDLIVISDGIINVPWAVEVEFNSWKAKTKCKAIGLTIGTSGRNGMEKVLDQSFDVTGISLVEEGVQACLAI